MKSIVIVLLAFSLLIGGFVLQTEIANLDMTEWNFTGHNIARAFVPNMGGGVMLVGIGCLVLIALERRNND